MSPSQIPHNIRAELARQGHTQEWLAERTGISTSTLWRRMGRDPERFTIDELFKIATALGVPLRVIVGSNGAAA